MILNLTAKEFGERLGTDYVTANGLLKLLQTKGVVKVLEEKVKKPSGRGKPSSVYEVPTEFTLSFKE